MADTKKKLPIKKRKPPQVSSAYDKELLNWVQNGGDYPQQASQPPQAVRPSVEHQAYANLLREGADEARRTRMLIDSGGTVQPGQRFFTDQAMVDARTAPPPAAAPAPVPAPSPVVALEQGIRQALSMRNSPEQVRGESFAQHIGGPAFNAPQQAQPDPVAKEMAVAAAHAAAAKLAATTEGHGMNGTIARNGPTSKEHPKLVIRGGSGPSAMQEHVELARANMEAVRNGANPAELPVLPAIGQGRTAEGAAAEKNAIASASDRQQNRRLKIKNSPQQLAVTEKAQSRDMSRRIRLRGSAGLTGPERQDPAALTAAGDNFGAQLAMRNKVFQNEQSLKDRELANKEKQTENERFALQGEYPGLFPGTPPTPSQLAGNAAAGTQLAPDAIGRALTAVSHLPPDQQAQALQSQGITPAHLRQIVESQMPMPPLPPGQGMIGDVWNHFVGSQDDFQETMRRRQQAQVLLAQMGG